MKGQGHKVTEKQLANLRPAKKGEVRNPKGYPPGKPKRLVTVLKGLPEDIQEKVYGILAYSLTLPDETAAKVFLECKQGELGQYGFVMQIAIKQLTKEGWGWNALMDIMDRLFGKPKTNVALDARGEGTVIIVNSLEEKEKLDNISNLQV